MTIPENAVKDYLTRTDQACDAIAGIISKQYGIAKEDLVEAAYNAFPTTYENDEEPVMTRPGDTIHDT